MADKAFITPNILKWARESARMTEETAASKVHVSIEKLREWEEGETQPTIRQAQALAKAYKRPFALFFLPEIPRDFQPLQDFRKSGSKELTTSSIFIIREIQQKQAWISDVYAENDEKQLPFVGKFTTKDAPEMVAKDILSTLNLNPALYKTDSPIKEWIGSAESSGIFVSRTSFIHSKMKLDSEELQGFAIADYFAPFVFVNSEDWSTAQLFTLVHELAHIWIAATGISNYVDPIIINRDKFNPIELFCNEVAANALIPKEVILSFDKSVYNNSQEVFKSAKKLGVSSFAFLIRSLNLNIIPRIVYQNLKKQADIHYQEFLTMQAEREAALRIRRKEKPGGPNPYLLRLNKNSRLFTQVVFDALRSGIVQPTQASFLLGTSINNFHKLEAQMHR